MKRLLLVAVLGAAGLMLTPAMASAQFMPYGLNYQQRNMFVGPVNYPFMLNPRFISTSSMQFRTPIPTLGGNTSFTLSHAIATNRRPAGFAYVAYTASAGPYIYGQGGSYMTASTSLRPNLAVAQQKIVAQAQRELSLPGVKSAIGEQWNYEKGNNKEPMPEIGPLPDPIRVALAPADPGQVMSGEVLNVLLKEIIRMEGTGAKGPSAYIPPLLLDDVRFGGGPTGDLLNLSRQAGTLDFPSVFDDPALAMFRDGLEKDFAAVAVAVQAGKSPESEKLLKLTTTFQKAQDAAAPVIKNLPFEEAIAARRFLNSMANAIKALKAGAGSGLIDPKWGGEGVIVADLTRHMAKHKLQFGAAPRGGEEAYATMHRNLATYLFVLNQPKK